MGVKERVISCIFVVLLFCIASNLPRWILASTPTAEVILPISTSYTPTISCNGNLRAKDSMEQYATHPLMIEEVYVEAGNWVEKGDVLLKIDTETSLQLATVRDVATPTAASNQTEYYLELAKQYDLEEEVLQYITQQQNTKQQTVTSAAEHIEEYVTAAASGRIHSFTAQSGQLLEAGSKIYSISKGEVFQAVLEIAESDISQVSLGDRVVLTGEGLGEKNFSAVVTHIAPEAKQVFKGLSQNTIVEVIAEFCSNDKELRPGLTLQAQIATEDASATLSLPYEAIAQDENNREYVYQLIDGIPQKQYIQVKKELTDYVQIEEGIEELAPVFLNNNDSISKQNYRIVLQEEQNG